MANKANIGASVTLDGEKEYKQALTGINNELKVTASSLTLVTARYSDNAKSVTALTEKGNVLSKSIEGQQAKVGKMKDALAHAAATYGETDAKTLKWRASLNLAETQLIKLEDDLKNNTKSLKTAKESMAKYGLSADEVAKQTGGFGGKISSIISSLGIDLPAGADKAIKALDSTKLATAALVAGSVALVKGFADATIQTSKLADDIMVMSTVTGLSTDTIQEMNYASELLDVSTETMAGSMKKMISNMQSAKGGTGEVVAAFKTLHVSVTDGNKGLADAETTFYKIIDALGKIPNETQRDALALKIFGKSATDLNPLIEAGSKGLKEFADQAEQMGYVMDESTLKSFGKLDDTMKTFDNQAKTFKNSIAIVMLPILTSFFEFLNKLDPKVVATVAIIGSIVVVAVSVAAAVGQVTTIFGAMSPAMLKTTLIVVGVTAALIALAAIIAVIIGKGDDLSQTMNNVGDNVGKMTSTVNGASSKLKFDYSYASGIDYVPSDRIALIHKGERVQRADENPYNPNATKLHTANGIEGNTYITLNVKLDEVDEVHKLVDTVKRAKQASRAGLAII